MTRVWKRIRAFAVLLLLIGVAGVAALFVSLPRPVTRRIAVASASWMLDPDAPSGRVVGTLKRLVAGYVQTAVASDIAATLDEGTPDDDVRNLARIMSYVREHMLTAHQFAHTPFSQAALVRGVGYCDQVNAAVATIAAVHFDRTELYAFVDPVTGLSPHTVGRVWSEQRRAWLYFDAFYADAVLFTKDAAGRPRYLDTGIAGVPARGVASRSVDQLDGVTLVRFQPTYGSYLVSRLRRSGDPPPLSAPPVPDAPPEAAKATDDATFRRVARAFVAARIEDLFGERPVEAYRRIAADPAVKRDERAAEIAALARTISDAENVTR